MVKKTRNKNIGFVQDICSRRADEANENEEALEAIFLINFIFFNFIF